MDKQPLVSIILPVYNGEKLLPIALDSIVNQSYKNIEVVAVNNSSTDHTLEILEEYARRYPQIKIYTIPHEPYSSGARKYGYSASHGDYITTCDGDDRMDLRAIEHLIDVAEKGYDIVIAPHYETVNGVTKLVHQTNRFNIEGYLLDTNPGMWSKLIRREFYFSHEPINSGYPFEDSIYHYTVLPYAKIGYCKFPTYYYFRWLSSGSMVVDVDKVSGFIDSYDYILNHIPEHCEETAFFGVIRWYLSNITSRWIVADQLIHRIKKYWPQIKEHEKYFSHQSRRTYELAKLYAELPDEPMPSVVYINGFGAEENALAERISELRGQAFHGGCTVVVMDEKNCDPAENELVRRAYEAGDWDFVGGYFALRKIYENGGTYLHWRIKLQAPLNCVTYYRSFFARMSENTYSGCIFGGMAGEQVFKSILDTYTETFYPEPFYPLAARINNILVSKYRVPMGTDTSIFKYATVVLAPDVTLHPAREDIVYAPIHLCYHDFSDMIAKEGYLTVPAGLLRAVSAAPAPRELREKAAAYDSYDRRFDEMKKWKRGVVLYFMDRGRFKEKARKNLGPYPLIYKTARAAYRLTHKGER